MGKSHYMLFNLVAAQFAVNCENPRVRKDFRVVQQEGNWMKVVETMRIMKNTGRMTYYAKMHLDIFSQIHDNMSFLTWHRAFIWEFENELRAIGGDDITLPYIDWGTEGDSYDGQVDQGVANHPYYYAQMDSKTQCLTGQIYDSFYLNPIFNDGQCIARANQVDQDLLIAGWADIDNEIISNTDFPSFDEAIQYGFHADVHLRFGGHMGSHFSPIDPLFFAHHSFVDLTLNTWQYVHSNWYDMGDEPLAWSSFQINNNTYYHGQVFQMLNQCVQYQRYGSSETSGEVNLQKRATASSNDTTSAATATSTEIMIEQVPVPASDATETAEAYILKVPESPVVTKEQLEAYAAKLKDYYGTLKQNLNDTDACRTQIGGFHKNSFLPTNNKPDPEKLKRLGLDPIKYEKLSVKREDNRNELEGFGQFVRKSVEQVIDENKDKYLQYVSDDKMTAFQDAFTADSAVLTMALCLLTLLNFI